MIDPSSRRPQVNSMRHRNPLLFRAVPFVLALAHSTPLLAQATPTKPARAGRKNADDPIEEFDLERAIVSDTGGLTADEVAQRATGRSPQIQSAKATANSAEWDAKTAWNG